MKQSTTMTTEKRKEIVGKVLADPHVQRVIEQRLAALEAIDVTSSNGTLTVNRRTGDVVSCSVIPGGDECIARITKFDMEEWKRHYQTLRIPETIDILDLGYWHDDPENRVMNAYEYADSDWRDEFRKGRAPQGPFENRDEWDEAVTQEMMKRLECNHSDASGWLEAQHFYHDNAWVLGYEPVGAAEYIEIKVQEWERKHPAG